MYLSFIWDPLHGWNGALLLLYMYYNYIGMYYTYIVHLNMFKYMLSSSLPKKIFNGRLDQAPEKQLYITLNYLYLQILSLFS